MTSGPEESSVRAAPVGMAATVLAALLFGLLALGTWRRLGDPMIDFGREAYMAWRVAEGASLGGEVTTLFGPLSILVNAGLWRLGGSSLTPVLLANLLVAALAAGCLLVTARQVFRASTSALLVAVFLVTFAFAQLRPFGSFSFPIPYAHAATHGALFTYACLAFLVAYARRPEPVRLAGGALAAGVTWLLKPELAVATTLAVATVLLLAHRGSRRSHARAALLIFLPSLVFLVVATLAGAGRFAVEALVRPWIFALRAPLDASGYYAVVSGLDAPAENVAAGLVLALMLACAIAGLVLLDLAVSRARISLRLAAGGGALAATFMPLYLTSAWLGLGPALPYLLLVVVGVALRERVQRTLEPEAGTGSDRNAALLVWGILALALLARVLLRARLDHYGFYLAGPGLLLLLGILLDEIPSRVRRWRTASGPVTALGSLGVATAVLMGSFQLSEHWLVRKTALLGTGGDRIHALDRSVDPRPVPVREVIRLVRTHTRESEGVLVVPEGGIINYLARRRSPVTTSTLLPPEIAAVGSETLLGQVREDPPALVVLAPGPLADYGGLAPGASPALGADILRWVRGRYEPAASFADSTDRGVVYELVVLRPSGRSDP